MKPITLAFLLAGSLLLWGCEGGPSSSSVQTQVVANLTASALPPTPMNTPHPCECQIVSLLNANLQALNQDPLSQTLDASYIVTEADFPPGPGNQSITMDIHVRCECAMDGSCCNIEHTFVVLAQAMKLTPDILIMLVPSTVEELIVSCYNHTKLIGSMSVYWETMRGYLVGNGATGYELGAAVRKIPTPTP